MDLRRNKTAARKENMAGLLLWENVMRFDLKESREISVGEEGEGHLM